MKKPLFACCLALAASALAPAAAQQVPDRPLDGAARRAVISALSEKLRSDYVFPDIAADTAKALAEKERKKGYDEFVTAQSFASALNEDLRRIGNDKHFGVNYAPNFDPPPPPSPNTTPPPEFLDQMRRMHEQGAYGVAQVSRLDGNIGYMDLRGFGMPEFTAPAFEGAMRLLYGSDAIIVDLRSNGGGNPASVALMMSHFFALGDERHLNDIYERPTDTTREFWTSPSVQTRYTGPVYVLTSGNTFSGGEEFAYDMQTQKRATLFGETTGGGANPGSTMKLAEGFIAFIPNGRAINPITGTNWEHVGVKPDVPTPAADAMATAYSAALKEALERDDSPEAKAARTELIGRFERGEVNLPAWSPPRF